MGTDRGGVDDLRAALMRDLDAGFERVVRSYEGRLYSFALRMTGDPRDAEEATQDAFVRAFRALATWPPERIASMSLAGWLYRITLNVVRNRMRGHRPVLVGLDGLGAAEPADRRDGPERVIERAVDRDRLETMLLTLPERYRAAVVLRHVEDLSYPEVAEALGQPLGTVKSNVHRGVALLRAAMSTQQQEVVA